MKLIIRIENGRPFEHPIFEDNFRMAFPDVDIENLPNNFAIFERVPQPQIGPYEIIENLSYEFVDNIVKDVWNIRTLTQEEKIAKQNLIKTKWYRDGGFASWIFSEELCQFVPPIPYPQDDKLYSWDESTGVWTEVT